MTPSTSNTKINAGFVTEENHYDKLTLIFGNGNVSAPKNSGGGSDFIVTHKDQIITFESKTSNTDIYDAGVINMFANGHIFHASAFLTNTHIEQIETWVQNEIGQVIDYTTAANTNSIPHIIEKDLYNEIKAEKKLINIVSKSALNNIVEDSFIKSKNRFVKANYIIIGDLIYRISDNPNLDPLKLEAPVLNEEDIAMTSVRTARSGSKNGRANVTIRTQFKMNKELKPTEHRLSTLKDSLNI